MPLFPIPDAAHVICQGRLECLGAGAHIAMTLGGPDMLRIDSETSPHVWIEIPIAQVAGMTLGDSVPCLGRLSVDHRRMKDAYLTRHALDRLRFSAGSHPEVWIECNLADVMALISTAPTYTDW